MALITGRVDIQDPLHWTWVSDKAKNGDAEGFAMEKDMLEKCNPGSGMVWISNHKHGEQCIHYKDDPKKFALCVIDMMKLDG